jgi:hypothetical protein
MRLVLTGARALPQEQLRIRVLPPPQPAPPRQHICLPLQCAASASLAFTLASISSNLQLQRQGQEGSGVSVGRTDPAGGEEIGRVRGFCCWAATASPPKPARTAAALSESCRCNERTGNRERGRKWKTRSKASQTDTAKPVLANTSRTCWGPRKGRAERPGTRSTLGA